MTEQNHECEKQNNVILIVDDNLNNLNVLSDILETSGYEVLVANDGESALKRARLGCPDLILLDIMMPGMDGFETLKQLKRGETTGDIPVIFVTALSDTGSKLSGFELGGVDYITKPIQPDEVLARVRTHLAIRNLRKGLTQKNNQLKDALGREQELGKLKSQLINIASHDLRTPLTIISFACEAILQQGSCGESSAVQKHVERIRKSSVQIEELLNDMLILSRAGARKYNFKPELLNIYRLCLELTDEQRGSCKDSHTIVFTGLEEDFQALVDPRLLRHILGNLLSNAVKYSAEGTRVELFAFHRDEYLEFRVTDQGIGISPVDLKQLFKSYFRGKNVGIVEGSGLGLAIARQLTVLHGGEIQVESELGQGSTFIVTLPYSPFIK